jgi:hypothetical protein
MHDRLQSATLLFTFCFYRLWQNKWIGGERFVFNETHLQKICFPKLKNYEIKLKKERTSEQCTEFVKTNRLLPYPCRVKQPYAWQAISTLNEDPGLSRLCWGVVVFRRRVILCIEMLSKWRLPSISVFLRFTVSELITHFWCFQTCIRRT